MRAMTIVLTMALMLVAASAMAYELVDGWNVDQPAGAGMIYGYPANYAMKYIPSQSYMLAKVEIWGCGSEYFEDDVITLQIQTDLGGEPSGEVLATVDTPVVDGDQYWAGSDFPEAIMVSPDVEYWLIYFPMAWSPVGWSPLGDEYETMWSSDQIHWDPVDPIRWKAKFWGDPVVATENATWSQIKGMYR